MTQVRIPKLDKVGSSLNEEALNIIAGFCLHYDRSIHNAFDTNIILHSRKVVKTIFRPQTRDIHVR